MSRASDSLAPGRRGATAGATPSVPTGIASSASGVFSSVRPEPVTVTRTSSLPAPHAGSTNDNGRRPLSHRLWGIDWNDLLPVRMSDSGLTVVVGDWSRIASFLRDHSPQLVERTSAPLSSALRLAKARFISEFSDMLELKLEGRTIGVFVGHPEDWSCYYIRALVADRDRAPRYALRTMVREVVAPTLFAAGVQRVAAETAPDNDVMIRCFLSNGFRSVGKRVTDRWGPLLRFSRRIDGQ